MKSNRTGLIIALLIIAGLLVASVQFYSAWYSATDKSDMKGYLGIVLEDLAKDPVGLLFGQTEGSAPFLPYFLLGLTWIWGSMFVRWRTKRYTYFWSNLAWSLIATGIVLTAWIWGSVVQYNSWYACTSHIVKGVTYSCYPGEQGALDFTTHMATCAALVSVTLTVDVMALLGLCGRLGRLLEANISFIATAVLLPLWWEWAETLHPERYWSAGTNSLTDWLAAINVVLLVVLAYNAIVPFLENPSS